MVRVLSQTLLAACLLLPVSAAQAADCTAAIQKIIVQQLEIDSAKVVPGAKLVDDLMADELDRIEIVMSLEEQFGVDIPDEVAEQLLTVADVVAYVNKNAKNTKGCR